MTWKRGHHIDLLEEEHHRIYGSKWALGLDQFEYLIQNGLQPNHNLLDFGCGAGRAGIHLIDYLDIGNYVGIDGHVPSINAFVKYELELNRLNDKKPTVACLNLEKERFHSKLLFDYVLAFSVFNHMKDHSLAMQNIAEVIRKDGVLISTFAIPSNYPSYGFEIFKSERLRSRLVTEKNIDWYVLKKL